MQILYAPTTCKKKIKNEAYINVMQHNLQGPIICDAESLSNKHKVHKSYFVCPLYE